MTLQHNLFTRLIGITKGQINFSAEILIWPFLILQLDVYIFLNYKGGNIIMTVQKFLAIAFLIFLLGIGILYTGVNRVPFRNSKNHEHHQSNLLTDDAALNSSRDILITMRTSNINMIPENEKRS
ncbi:hypothetical protein SAMN04515679_2026 [Pelosinus fermentans]|uniref:Uncharacterized protein n=2 Tax=Sporomusaceae TaxID=1843490 RepID=I8RD70_9FIRM|nr:hypothetical protein FB4_4524 [Pelosinus fermentans B4]EIW23033.1 hypothetical protein FA11_4474 [Pelosinus fermentans A11]OAM93926.1 hypothetical protein FR7_01943 [Pelosinus fermentans DSM 17108]SDQ94632.1 hypothetical protein SAMN04515679_2026 [Pelosinus fermentans]